MPLRFRKLTCPLKFSHLGEFCLDWDGACCCYVMSMSTNVRPLLPFNVKRSYSCWKGIIGWYVRAWSFVLRWVWFRGSIIHHFCLAVWMRNLRHLENLKIRNCHLLGSYAPVYTVLPISWEHFNLTHATFHLYSFLIFVLYFVYT